MINKMKYITIIFTAILILCLDTSVLANERTDLTEQMKDSLVFLTISTGGYRTREPWKQKSLSDDYAYGCAVSENEVITTADRVSNLVYIKALRYGQNEFINAKLKVVDYQANLCLIELDSNQLSKPLKPLTFTEDYKKGNSVDSYWMSSDKRVFSKRGYLDRVRVDKVRTSFVKHLRYLVSDVSQRTDSGEVYCEDLSPIGIACRSNGDNEAGLIPAETILKFLKVVKDGNYEGFGCVGFAASDLLDPALRSYLKMPETLNYGVYVSDVFTLGTGCDDLKIGDVILKIDDTTIDPYGLFENPKYGQLELDYLITNKNAGQDIKFEIWRDGKSLEIQTTVKNFKSSDMLIPYHEYDLQPEYMVVAGFVFQKLSREYLLEFGADIAGNAPTNLYYYYLQSAFKPTDERKDIVILSFVLPNQYNMGYTNLGQMIVSTYNGKKISSIDDVIEAQKLNTDSLYDVIEFEMDNPTLVIARNQISAANAFVSTNYGIRKLVNINK
ncbi:MAG: hypothetical protein JXA96_04570 [Sedimentisphaerales bacterium]|nr:hypothetical protein [Sedimentisphaerales bacterium]